MLFILASRPDFCFFVFFKFCFFGLGDWPMNEAYHKRKNFEHPMHSQLIDINSIGGGRIQVCIK
jgi:hypothetical protein